MAWKQRKADTAAAKDADNDRQEEPQSEETDDALPVPDDMTGITFVASDDPAQWPDEQNINLTPSHSTTPAGTGASDDVSAPDASPEEREKPAGENSAAPPDERDAESADEDDTGEVAPVATEAPEENMTENFSADAQNSPDAMPTVPLPSRTGSDAAPQPLPSPAPAVPQETAQSAALRAWWTTTGKPVLARHWPDILIVLAAIIVIVALVTTGSTARQRREEITTYQSAQAKLEREFGFNPGYIVSDDVMFDSDSMTESEIATFLSERGVNCTGDLCLSTIKVSSSAQEPDDLCRGYGASDGLTAAHVIRGVAESCGINPQVLLVMLQKEQGLVTATSPTETAYTIAMGLSCPDNGMCDTAYYGFFTQVYGAAHRLKYYQAHFDQYNYKPHEVNDILYNPNVECGSDKVYIENDATAMLYIYTPYQPNEAALEGLRDGKGGTGDECSTYGNRNFALFFNAWFGDPTSSASD